MKHSEIKVGQKFLDITCERVDTIVKITKKGFSYTYVHGKGDAAKIMKTNIYYKRFLKDFESGDYIQINK